MDPNKGYFSGLWNGMKDKIRLSEYLGYFFHWFINNISFDISHILTHPPSLIVSNLLSHILTDDD